MSRSGWLTVVGLLMLANGCAHSKPKPVIGEDPKVKWEDFKEADKHNPPPVRRGATPAAGYNEAEKRSIAAIVQANLTIARAEFALAEAIRVAPIEARPLVADVLTATVTPARELNFVFGALIGAAADLVDANHAAWNAAPRKEHLSGGVNGLWFGAWPYLDRVQSKFTGLPVAIQRINTARNLAQGNNDYQGALQAAAQALGQASEELKGVDRTLTYENFFPQPLLPGQTISPLVGPHGDYLKWAHRIWRSRNYAHDQALATIPFYKTGGNKFNTSAYRDYFIAYSNVVALEARAMGLAIGVAVDPSDAKDVGDQFCAVLRATDLLTDFHDDGGGNVPRFFHRMNESLVAALGMDPALRFAFERFSDSWANSDDAAWRAFIFVNEPQRSRCPTSSLSGVN